MADRAETPEPTVTLHASCVVLGDRAALITGPSGSGKSRLALELMAMGARLVADDRTQVTRVAGVLRASAPAALRGRIEARGVGILRAEAVATATLVVCADLAATESARLPAVHTRRLLDCTLAVLHKPASGGFPAALLQYMKFPQDV